MRESVAGFIAGILIGIIGFGISDWQFWVLALISPITVLLTFKSKKSNK